MRKELVKVISANGHHMRFVTTRQALEMIAEDYSGNEVDGIAAVARRTTRKKAALTEIKMLALVRNEKPSPCTLTQSDMVANAEGAANPEVRKRGKNKLAIGNNVDQAMTKVEAWADAHDDRNVVISAGSVFGAALYCPWPREQFTSFI